MTLDADVLTADAARTPLYFEDLEVGQVHRSGTLDVDAEAIKTFAAYFDPQPFHVDEEAAKATFFRGLAASGWHTAGLTMRLLVTSGLPLAGGIIGAGMEIKWPRPTRPGDTLHVESEVLELRASSSRPNQGLAKIRNTTFNQNNEPVQIMEGTLVVARRKAT